VPYEHPPAELAARLKAHGLKMVLFDAPMGNWDAATAVLAACRAGKRNSATASRASLSTATHWIATPSTPWPGWSARPGLSGRRTHLRGEPTYAAGFLKGTHRSCDQPINKKMG